VSVEASLQRNGCEFLPVDEIFLDVDPAASPPSRIDSIRLKLDWLVSVLRWGVVGSAVDSGLLVSGRVVSSIFIKQKQF